MVDWDMVIIAMIAEEEEEEEQQQIKRRKIWVNDLWLQRNLVGEYQTLSRGLLGENFYNYIKMSREKFDALLQFLKPDIEKQNTKYRAAISAEERLLICLRFLTTGSSFKSLAFNYRVGYTTYRRIVHETCAVIWQKLGPVVMPKPTEELWLAVEEDFRNIWNFPNCVGAIDGKHVNIRAPNNSGSQYFNYKKFFSTVLLAVVDAKYKFIVVDCGAYGRNSDGGIFSNSKLGQMMRNKSLGLPPNKSLPGTNIELPHVFVADEAFPLSENIMRPYSSNSAAGDHDKKVFNYRLSRARRLVESAFGILMQKFEIFERRLKVQPNHLPSIILACTCLHNYIIEANSDLHQRHPSHNISVQNLRAQEESDAGFNMAIRDHFKQYFNSQQGSVSWQDNIIERS